jgi:hypothetical protein
MCLCGQAVPFVYAPLFILIKRPAPFHVLLGFFVASDLAAVAAVAVATSRCAATSSWADASAITAATPMATVRVRTQPLLKTCYCPCYYPCTVSNTRAGGLSFSLKLSLSTKRVDDTGPACLLLTKLFLTNRPESVFSNMF